MSKMAGVSALKERLAQRKFGGGAVAAGRKAKTVTELEEEEARIKALDDEIAEMERKDRERWKRIKRFFTPPDVVGYIKKALRDKLKIALKKLADKKGTQEMLFAELQIISKKEKWMWVDFWNEFDDRKHNRINYQRFCSYFRLLQDSWTKRIFEIANVSKTGSLSFIDWLYFCKDYLYVDRLKSEEFSFRLISRRGVSFRPAVSVIDLEDMRLFLKFRYKMKDISEQKLFKNALDVFDYVDSDGDGGLYLDEFTEFSIQNCVFLRFTHNYQNHFRKIFFGIKYWVEKTRLLKKSNATGFARMKGLSSINAVDERWTNTDLRDPVVDDRGKPIVTSVWVEPKKTYDTDSLSTGQQREYAAMALEIFEHDEDEAEKNLLKELGIDDKNTIKHKSQQKQLKKAKQNLAPIDNKKFTLDVSI
jgi:hypothetical protein